MFAFLFYFIILFNFFHNSFMNNDGQTLRALLIFLLFIFPNLIFIFSTHFANLLLLFLCAPTIIPTTKTCLQMKLFTYYGVCNNLYWTQAPISANNYILFAYTCPVCMSIFIELCSWNCRRIIKLSNLQWNKQRLWHFDEREWSVQLIDVSLKVNYSYVSNNISNEQ